MKKIVIISLFFLTVINVSFACDFMIGNDEWYFTNWEIHWRVVQPGDEICIESWERWYLKFIGLKWSKNSPIIIKNEWWLVNIDTDHAYGLALSDSEFIHIRWDWDRNYDYGIKVRDPKAWHVVSIGWWSTDVEVNNLEIYGQKYDESYSALWAKTDPKCGSDFVRWKFEMKNIIVHDNYIHDINQWFYFGWTFFTRVIDCWWYNIQWHIMQWVKIYDNIIKRVWQDGLQVSSALSTNGDCEIYGNYLEDTSLKNLANQRSSITVWWGSKCDVYDNVSINSNGPWVLFLGYEWKIYNNLIIDAGQEWDNIDWIFIDHRSGDDYKNGSIEIYDNTIVNPARNGIRFYNKYAKNNFIANNLIVNPWFDAHKNHWAWKENGNYIYLEKWRINRDEINDWDDIWDYLSVVKLSDISDIGDINNLGLSDIDYDLLDKIKHSNKYWVREFFSLYQNLLENTQNDKDYNNKNNDNDSNKYNEGERNYEYFLWWTILGLYFPTREDIQMKRKIVNLIEKKYKDRRVKIRIVLKNALKSENLDSRIFWIISQIVKEI